MSSRKSLVAVHVEARIRTVRGTPVLLDSDLAVIYGVRTGALNQAVTRNKSRFPDDFRFRLTRREQVHLISQIVTSSAGHGGRRKLPWVFTEHGAIMAATVLKSPRAIEMSLFVVRAFVRLRDVAGTQAELGRQLAVLERRVTAHDASLGQVFTALRRLLRPPDRAGRRIGFLARTGLPLTGWTISQSATQAQPGRRSQAQSKPVTD